MTPLLPVGLIDATIGNGVSLSGAVELDAMCLCGVITPSGWDTAALTFQVSPDGVTYYNLWDGASELSYAAIAASTYVAFNPALFYAVRFIKVRSGTSGTAVNQNGAVTLTLVCRTL